MLLGVAYGAFKAYQSTARMIETKLTPSLARLEGLLANLEKSAAVVRTRTEDMNHAIGAARDAATRIGAAVWPRAAVAASVAGGVLGAIRRWHSGRGEGENVKVVAG